MISVPWAGLSRPLAILALLHAGAIFGFFYAWACSTVWGLDAADPNVAIPAMQAMNASVRNPGLRAGLLRHARRPGGGLVDGLEDRGNAAALFSSPRRASFTSWAPWFRP